MYTLSKFVIAITNDAFVADSAETHTLLDVGCVHFLEEYDERNSIIYKVRDTVMMT